MAEGLGFSSLLRGGQDGQRLNDQPCPRLQLAAFLEMSEARIRSLLGKASLEESGTDADAGIPGEPQTPRENPCQSLTFAKALASQKSAPQIVVAELQKAASDEKKILIESAENMRTILERKRVAEFSRTNALDAVRGRVSATEACARAAQLAIFHTFQSHRRGDPVTAQSMLLKNAAEKTDCARKEVVEIAHLFRKFQVADRNFTAIQASAADATNDLLRDTERHLLVSQLTCHRLREQAKHINMELVKILNMTHSDAVQMSKELREAGTAEGRWFDRIESGHNAAAYALAAKASINAHKEFICKNAQAINSQLQGALVSSQSADLAQNMADDVEREEDEEVKPKQFQDIDTLTTQYKTSLEAYQLAKNADLSTR